MMKKNYSTMMKTEIEKVFASIETRKDEFVMRPGVDFTRLRMCSFIDIMKIILSMNGGSLEKELIDLFPSIDDRMTASAFVQQRSKIKPEAFRAAFCEFNDATAKYDNATYNGYHLFAADGTAVNIAKNPKSETYFDRGFNQFHLVALYDLCNKTYRDLVVQPRPKMNEIAALTEMVRRVTLPEKSIIICDRGFGQYNLFETIKRSGSEYLIRVRDAFSRETRDLPMEELDTDVSIELRTTQSKKDKADFNAGIARWVNGPSRFGKDKKKTVWEYGSPYRLSMRIVRFKLSSGNYETIITSLNRFEFPLEEIKKLYAMRWGIETSFRELKYAVGLTNLHARKEDFVLQEIYAHMLMYNFSMRITMRVGLTKAERKYYYQVNFKTAFYICKQFFRGIARNVEAEIATHITPIRPGRSDERKNLQKSFIAFPYRVA